MPNVPAGEFEAKRLSLLKMVQAGGEPILITKSGNPVACLMPVGKRKMPSKPNRPLFGASRHILTVLGDIDTSEHSDEEWERVSQDEWRHTSTPSVARRAASCDNER